MKAKYKVGDKLEFELDGAGQKELFKEIEGRIKLEDESLKFKDKFYEYWTKTTKEGNYTKHLRKKINSLYQFFF